MNTEEKNLLQNYSSVGQMNHAMVAVPSASDTLWVECTNQEYPLGYRHAGIAGHQVLLVNENGGKLVRVGDYDYEKSLCTDSCR